LRPSPGFPRRFLPEISTAIFSADSDMGNG
jgi:hypothetical protein